jgi:limonene-1,2-epoxide hydrolase
MRPWMAINVRQCWPDRVDYFVYESKRIHARVMGAFEMNGDKIAAWRDYFGAPNSPSSPEPP